MTGTLRARLRARSPPGEPRHLPSSVDEWLASLSGSGRARRRCWRAPGSEQLRPRIRPHAARDRAAAGHVGGDGRADAARARRARGLARRRRVDRRHGLRQLALRGRVRRAVAAGRARPAGRRRSPAGSSSRTPRRACRRDGPFLVVSRRALGRQPGEPRGRRLAAREPPAGAPPVHHLQPRRRARHGLRAAGPACASSCSTRRRTTAAS